MTDKEAMKLALDALETEVSIDWTNNDEFNASAEKMHEAIAALKERLAQPHETTLKEFHQFIHDDPKYHIWAKEKEALAEKSMREMQRLGQEIEQEPVAWWNNTGTHIDLNVSGRGTPLYTHPPQRTWIGLEGAEAGWFCHTDFLNARKYTKKQREHICCQLLSEAQSWDIKQYQLMMHDSTKLKETT